MKNPQHEPLASHAVAVSCDGCVNWWVDLPAAWGTQATCLEFISQHKAPKGCEFEIVDLESGRVVSYLYHPAQHRIRLTMQDLKDKKD